MLLIFLVFKISLERLFVVLTIICLECPYSNNCFTTFRPVLPDAPTTNIFYILINSLNFKIVGNYTKTHSNEWVYFWWAHQDSNLGPPDYESGALTN